MPAAEQLQIELHGSVEMEACCEALLAAGHSEDDPLVTDLEVTAKRAEQGAFEKPFTINVEEAPTVREALIRTLRSLGPEEQVDAPARRILRHMVYL